MIIHHQETISVLQIVDIGLGTLDGNAASVFSQLQGATNNSRTINSFANMKTSVQVLVSLSGKLQEISNTSTVNVSISAEYCCWVITDLFGT